MKTKVAFLSAFLSVFCMSALAQSSYPSKPIRIIASAPPGGAFDFVARVVADGLQRSLRQPAVVENKSGAGGVIGVDAAAKSPADGYTLVVGSTGPITVSPSLVKNLPYDPVKDLAPIARLVRMPSYLVVHPSVPAANLGELLQLARAKPGKLTYASTGNGLSQMTNVELLKSMANIDVLPISYRGSGPALIDFVAGRIDMMIELGPQAIPHIKSGRLKVLAVSTATRTDLMPEVPTIAESGVPGFDAFTWFALYAPAGTPKEIVQRLHASVVEIFSDPTLKERLATFGCEVAITTPEELAAFQASETAKWAAVIKSAGIKPE